MFTTAPRSQLQSALEQIVVNVYFQPPADFVMEYPCIVYRRAPGSHHFADNKLYHYTQQYEVTLISRDPDMDAQRMSILSLRNCKHDVSFAADNLNHDVFSIYF